MLNGYFQTGSIKARFLKLARFLWLEIRKLGQMSLAGISSGVKSTFRWWSKLNWINLLKAVKLVVEIAEKIRSLLFYDQTAHFVQVAG